MKNLVKFKDAVLTPKEARHIKGGNIQVHNCVDDNGDSWVIHAFEGDFTILYLHWRSQNPGNSLECDPPEPLPFG